MSVFVDTSAFYALMVSMDDNHTRAGAYWGSLMETQEPAVSSSYVLLETVALLQARIGIEAIRRFHHVVRPALTIQWVDVTLHDAAMDAVLEADRRRLSLVDCASFAIMRRLAIDKAFTFDVHFREEGFTCLPD